MQRDIITSQCGLLMDSNLNVQSDAKPFHCNYYKYSTILVLKLWYLIKPFHSQYFKHITPASNNCFIMLRPFDLRHFISLHISCQAPLSFTSVRIHPNSYHIQHQTLRCKTDDHNPPPSSHDEHKQRVLGQIMASSRSSLNLAFT